MKRAISTQPKYRAIGIYSLFAVLVIVGLMSLFNPRATVMPNPAVTPAAGGPGTPVSNPAVTDATFHKVRTRCCLRSIAQANRTFPETSQISSRATPGIAISSPPC